MKRYWVLGLSIVLALALAVPALGGPTNPVASISASVKSVANKALKKAKAAQNAANAAQSAANAAQSTANEAKSTATEAQKTAKTAQTAANGAQGTANTALSVANDAKKRAENAQNTANEGVSKANAAQATANGKMSGEEGGIEGSAGTLSIAACPTGKVATGGGFILTGANNNAATATESTQYLNGWIATAEQIEGTAGASWAVVATVNCATSP